MSCPFQHDTVYLRNTRGLLQMTRNINVYFRRTFEPCIEGVPDMHVLTRGKNRG